MVYDAENRIKSFFRGSNGGSTPDATYQYDGEGKRVRKTADGVETIFVYNAGRQLVAEYATQITTTPEVSYLTADHLGSPRIVTNALGQVRSRHDYLAFGDEVNDTVGNIAGRTSAHGYGEEDGVRKQYTGYERDDESGLDYAQARMHTYVHGRFTSPDPILSSGRNEIPQSWNRYSYVLNNPAKNVDPLGFYEWSAALGGSSRDDDLKSKIKGIQDDKHLSAEEKASKIAGVNGILTLRQQFRDALSLSRTIVSRADVSDSFRSSANAMLSGYGTENDGNNRIVAIRNNEDADAFTRWEDGKTVVAIAPSEFSSNTFAFTVFHEGIHAMQLGFWNSSKQAGFEINPPVAAVEFEAYFSTTALVRGLDSAFVNSNMASSGPRAYSANGTTLWQRGWTEADMGNAITTYLQNLGNIDSNGKTTDRGARGAFPGGGARQWK